MTASYLHLLTTFAYECKGHSSLLGFPHWYEYLPVSDNCTVVNFNPFTDWPQIGLAAVGMMLRVGGLVAIGYIIFGSFKYVTSQGSPDGTKDAQNTIVNALAGLVIVAISTGLVGFLGNRFGG